MISALSGERGLHDESSCMLWAPGKCICLSKCICLHISDICSS